MVVGYDSEFMFMKAWFYLLCQVFVFLLPFIAIICMINFISIELDASQKETDALQIIKSEKSCATLKGEKVKEIRGLEIIFEPPEDYSICLITNSRIKAFDIQNISLMYTKEKGQMVEKNICDCFTLTLNADNEQEYRKLTRNKVYSIGIQYEDYSENKIIYPRKFICYIDH